MPKHLFCWPVLETDRTLATLSQFTGTHKLKREFSGQDAGVRAWAPKDLVAQSFLGLAGEEWDSNWLESRGRSSLPRATLRSVSPPIRERALGVACVWGG